MNESSRYLALALVSTEEIEKRVHAVFVMKHLRGEMPVKELDSVTN